MNQRVKRSQDRKSTFATGGQVVQHSRDADPVIRTPQKTTGDVSGEKLAGLAKASPFFQKLEEAIKPQTQEEEKKAIAKATEKIIDEK